MTNEWSSQYNPFNSTKALVHSRNFLGVLEGKILPPIVVNMDLTNRCNYDCTFCMFGKLERADPNSEGYRFNKKELEIGYAQTLPKLWKDWGVKAVCLAGGGEPSVHKDFDPFVYAVRQQGLDLGIATNGFLVDNKDRWENLARSCRFVGFSMDAGNAQDYAITKGVGEGAFKYVLNNMKNLAQTRDQLGTNMRIGYKYVLDEHNWTSIYDAVRVARENGANDFHFRPAINPHHEFFADKLDAVWGQIEQGRKDFETEDFKVYGIRHKFNPNLTKKHCFNKCRASYLTSTWCADGKVYMCTDSRGSEWAQLIDHYPDPKKVIEFWGSKEHQDKVDKVDFRKNCDRCTLAPYQEYFEQIFIKDNTMRNLI